MICSCGNKGEEHVYNTFSFWYCSKCNCEIKSVEVLLEENDWIQLGLWDDFS